MLSNADLPEFGAFRAANLDLQHWALVWQYVHTIESTGDLASVALQLIRKSLKHYPVTFEFMKLAPDLQVKIFQRSFQLMENFTIDQKTLGLTGFVCFDYMGHSPDAVKNPL